MKNKQRAFCAFCQAERTFMKRPLDHHLHGVLALLTLGLWGVVWLFLVLRRSLRPLRCSSCRHRLRIAGQPVGESPYGFDYAALAENGENRSSPAPQEETPHKDADLSRT